LYPLPPPVRSLPRSRPRPCFSMFAWLKRFWRRPPAAHSTGERGALGERLAREHLRKMGLRILATNWRNPRDRRGEIDLVALDGQVLVFVEVKTRAAGALVAGHHAVDARKKRALLCAARAYLRGLDEPPRSVRFDVVEVALPESGHGVDGEQRDGPIRGPSASPPLSPALRHFKNLPLFPKGFLPRSR